jgi:hypothetical protein
MEERAQYGPWQERPRLVVIHDGGTSYSALPHDVLFDNAISPGARLLYAGLQAYWWKGGECFANHATLASDFGVSQRQIQRYLHELVQAGHIVERHHGRGQAKAYSPANTTDMSPLAPNTTDMSAQHDISVVPNTTDMSAPYKKTPVKKTKEEDLSIPAGSDERELFDYYRQKIQPAARINAPEKIRRRLKRFTVDELKAGIDHFAADAWWMENNGSRGAAWFFDSDKRSEQFLNLAPRAKPAPSANGAATYRTDAGREMTRTHSKWSDPFYDRVMGGAARRQSAKPPGQSDG